MSNEYPSIKNVFKRDPDTHRMTMEWSDPVFGVLRTAPWEITEKLDGTNVRIWRDSSGTHVRGRTDKAALQPELLEYCEQVAGRFDNEMTLYGEGVGPKIQKGGERYAPMQVFVVFDVKIGRFFLSRADVHDIAESLGILHAPYLGTMTLDGIVQRWLDSPPASVLHSDVPEGWVVRPAGGLLFRDGTPVRAKIKERDMAQLRDTH